jgi:hypothetical protein
MEVNNKPEPQPEWHAHTNDEGSTGLSSGLRLWSAAT